MRTISVRILLVISLLIGFGTSSVWAEVPSEKTSPNIKVEQWTGKVFTFLSLAADKQPAGYEIFPAEQGVRGVNGDSSLRIPYKEHVGKTVTVTEVVTFPAGDNMQEYMVYMKVNDTGEKLVGRTMRGQLEGLVLTADIENARKAFLGKTVYPKFRELSGLYVPGWNAMPAAAVPITIGGPVTVVDVYAGIQSREAIWLIVSVNGEKAILPMLYSWTNTPLVCWTEAPAWEEDLFIENPRISLGGSQDVWKNIQKGNVEEGTTKEQVALSWGKPPLNKETDSIWIYNTKILTFYGDMLNSIETSKDSQ